MSQSMSDRGQRKREEKQALSFPVPPPNSSQQTTGETVTVADGVLQARIAMPLALGHVNVYLLRDTDGWWLIDTGLNIQTSRRCWETIAANVDALEGLPFKALVCTHFHHDHAGLAHWLAAQFDIPLYMSHGEYFMLRAFADSGHQGASPTQLGFYQRAGMPPVAIDSLLEDLDAYPAQPACPDSYHRLREGQQLTIGERRWQVVIGEGHAPEHVCLYSEEDRLLLAGDQILPEISPNIMVGHMEPEADPMSGWFASLDRLAELAGDTLVMPGHGDVFRNLHERVQQLRDHHDRQFDSLRRLASETQAFTAFRAMRWLFPQELAGTQMLLALGETIAHLTWLTRHAEFRRDLHDRVHVYSRASQADTASAQSRE